jgi:fatty-acid desaturase
MAKIKLVKRPTLTPKTVKTVKAVEAVDPNAEAPHWFNICYLGLMHLGALYGLSLIPGTTSATNGVAIATFFLAEFGITAGAHRLWAHRTYTAHVSVEIGLAFCCSMANEGSILKYIPLTASHSIRQHHTASHSITQHHTAPGQPLISSSFSGGHVITAFTTSTWTRRWILTTPLAASGE